MVADVDGVAADDVVGGGTVGTDCGRDDDCSSVMTPPDPANDARGPELIVTTGRRCNCCCCPDAIVAAATLPCLVTPAGSVIPRGGGRVILLMPGLPGCNGCC